MQTQSDTHEVLMDIEAGVKRRKAYQDQQLAMSANAKVRAQKWSDLLSQSTKEQQNDPHAISR